MPTAAALPHSRSSWEQPQLALSQRHEPALDGIRGMAILLVVLYHFANRLDVNSLPGHGGGILRILGLGWCGVDLFFVLSGFLITGILIDSRDTPNYYFRFYSRRVLRIFPLYYVTLGFALFFVIAIFRPEGEQRQVFLVHHVASLFYLSNFATAWTQIWPSFGISSLWSLAIEEQFYLVWPWIVRRIERSAFQRICLALIGGAFFLRVGLLALGVWPPAIYVLTVTRLDALGMGALVALLLRGPVWSHVVVAAPRLWALSGIALVALFLGTPNYQDYSPLLLSSVYSALAIFFGATLVLAVSSPSGSPWRRIFCSPLLRGLGKYSYAIYLFHSFVLAAVWRALGHLTWTRVLYERIELPQAIVFLILYIAVLVVLALASWHLVEKHCLALKDGPWVRHLGGRFASPAKRAS